MRNPDYAALLELAKERLTIPEIWKFLSLQGSPPARETGACRSPFRPDRSPSFSIFGDGKLFKDHATGDQGDAVKFLGLATGLEGKELLDRFRELAGVQPLSGLTPCVPAPRPLPCPVKPREPEKRADRATMRVPTRQELEAIARVRHLSLPGVALAAKRGYLRTGTVRGFESWILCEPDGRTAAARRLDGEMFPGYSSGAPYKSHALSSKAWPMGITALPAEPRPNAAVLLLEGEGDFLAAFHFMAAWGEQDLYPVALLGKMQDLRPDAAQLLSGWRVRIFPHTDGWASAEKWAGQIPAGGKVDAFRFDGLRMSDGSPITDLNDCIRIHSGDAEALEEMNPLPSRPCLDPERSGFDFHNRMRALHWRSIREETEEGYPVLRDGTVCPF